MQRGSESAKEIARRHEVRQEINFGGAVFRVVAHRSGKSGDKGAAPADVLTDFYFESGFQRDVNFGARAEADHAEALAAAEVLVASSPRDDAAGDGSGDLPHDEFEFVLADKSPRACGVVG